VSILIQVMVTYSEVHCVYYSNCTTTGLGKGEEYEFPTLTVDISASTGRDLELAMERSRSKSPSTTIQMTRLTESRVGIYDDIRW